jgi:hypothetical protein
MHQESFTVPPERRNLVSRKAQMDSDDGFEYEDSDQSEEMLGDEDEEGQEDSDDDCGYDPGAEVITSSRKVRPSAGPPVLLNAPVLALGICRILCRVDLHALNPIRIRRTSWICVGALQGAPEA